jgi:general stress protein 26
MMKKNHPSYSIIEKELRRKTFAVITTVDIKNRPHATGILYGSSTPEDPLRFYIVTKRKSAKVRNIRENPNVSLLVTYPHYILRFIPDSTVTIRGTAEITTLEDEAFRKAFSQKRILRMNLEMDDATMEKAVVIKITPDPVIQCYGVGIGLNELRKDPTVANYKVRIPKQRLQ